MKVSQADTMGILFYKEKFISTPSTDKLWIQYINNTFIYVPELDIIYMETIPFPLSEYTGHEFPLLVSWFRE